MIVHVSRWRLFFLVLSEISSQFCSRPSSALHVLVLLCWNADELVCPADEHSVPRTARSGGFVTPPCSDVRSFFDPLIARTFLVPCFHRVSGASGFGFFVFIGAGVLCGLVSFAYFYLCDPILNGEIVRADQVTVSSLLLIYTSMYMYMYAHVCLYIDFIFFVSSFRFFRSSSWRSSTSLVFLVCLLRACSVLLLG